MSSEGLFCFVFSLSFEFSLFSFMIGLIGFANEYWFLCGHWKYVWMNGLNSRNYRNLIGKNSILGEIDENCPLKIFSSSI